MTKDEALRNKIDKMIEDLATWVRECGTDPDGSPIADPGVFRDNCDTILMRALGNTCAPYSYFRGKGMPALDTAAALMDLRLHHYDFGPGRDGLPGFAAYRSGVLS